VKISFGDKTYYNKAVIKDRLKSIEEKVKRELSNQLYYKFVGKMQSVCKVKVDKYYMPAP